MSQMRELLKQLVGVPIVIDGVEYPNEYADVLGIDRTDLESEFVNHSERYAYYATLAELADDRADRLKEDLDHGVRSKADAVRQQDPKFKMTETMVENEVKMSAAYKQMQTEYQEARRLAKILKNAPHAFAHRRDMLIELGKTAMSSMSDPRVQQGRQQLARNIISASRRAPMLPVAGGEPSDVLGPPTGKHCVVCNEAQHTSDSGDVCKNGHGGAPALEDASPEVLAANPGPAAVEDVAPPRRRAARSA